MAAYAGPRRSSGGLLGSALRIASLGLARAYAHLLRSVSTRRPFLDTDDIDWVADLDCVFDHLYSFPRQRVQACP